MRCYIKSKTLLYILLGILSLGFCLTKSENASAYTYWVNNPINYNIERTFYDTGGLHIKQVLNPNSYPANILGPDANGYNILYGFTINAVDINSNLYKQFNTVYFDIQIDAASNELGPYFRDNRNSLRLRVIANNTFQFGTCNVTEQQTNYVRYRCTAALTQNFKPNYAYILFGEMDNPVSEMFWAYPVTRRIQITYFGWGFDALDDPNTAYLQQLAEQNTTIINQNNQIINGQQQIDDSVNHPDYIDEERQELEDTQDDAEESANSAGEDVENSTSSLTQTMGQVVNEIRNAQPTNCNITINPRANQFEIGTINLCNAPARIRTMIETVVVVAVTLGVFRTCYSIFNQFMYYVRKEQE